jgi:hypothetical protein
MRDLFAYSCTDNPGDSSYFVGEMHALESPVYVLRTGGKKMRIKTFLVKTMPALVAQLCMMAASSAQPVNSGFFDDYSKLESNEALGLDYMYQRPGWEEIVRSTRVVVIPQPEIFLAPDSKYKGMKPDDMKELADLLRSGMFVALADGYQIADNPGPDTLVLRVALTNMHLKKKGRIPVIGYLPPAYIAGTAKRQLLNDFAQNILLTEAVVEMEVLNGESGEVLGQLIAELGDRGTKKEFASWEEMQAAATVAGLRLRCRLDNAKFEPEMRVNCLEAITLDDIASDD